MPFVRRDRTGQVVAVSMEAIEGFEEVPPDTGELLDFELRLAASRNPLQESDLDVVRVLDDLINLLVEKNAIRFTDLPAPAQHKLLNRRGLRESGPQLGLLGEDAPLL